MVRNAPDDMRVASGLAHSDGGCHPGGVADDDSSASAIADVARVRALLITAAREGRAISYSEMLQALGHRFTRPRMRALCRTLDAIDEAGRIAGEPELAVLVVRESDRLPGQGWWGGARRFILDYDGPWIGPRAAALVRRQQEIAFDYWRGRG